MKIHLTSRATAYSAAAAIVVLLLSGVVMARHADSERRLAELTQPSVEGRPGMQAPGQFQNAIRDKQRLREVWFARDTRDVTDELAAFLHNPSDEVRERAMNSLAQVAIPEAEAALQQTLDTVESKPLNETSGKELDPARLKMALSRVRSRDEKGIARASEIARSVGLSWGEVKTLSQRVNGSKRTELQGGRGDKMIDDVIDLLCGMARKGEKVQDIADDLSLNNAQKAKVKAAALPPVEEANSLLDYLTSLDVLRSEEYDIFRYRLLYTTPQISDLLLARIQDMKENPKKYFGLKPVPGHPGAYRESIAYVAFFTAASDTNDSRMIPMLRQFESPKFEPKVWQEAKESRERLENNLAVLNSTG